MRKKHLLIVHHGALGDVIAVFPALVLLGQRFSRLELLCRTSLGKLAHDLGLVHGYHSLESGPFASLYAGEPNPDVRRFFDRFDTVLLLSSSLDLESRVRAAGASDVARIPSRPPVEQHTHVPDFILLNLRDLHMVDAHGPLLPPAWDGGDPRMVVLSPGSGSRRKNWPFACFMETAARLESSGFSPVFLLGPAEEHLRCEAASRPGLRFRTLDDISELTVLLRGAGGYIGNDSGVSHLAAWLGLPSVVIFGPSDPIRWRPTGTAVRTLRSKVECEPCFEREAENCVEQSCLTGLTPRVVADAFHSLHTDIAHGRCEPSGTASQGPGPRAFTSRVRCATKDADV